MPVFSENGRMKTYEYNILNLPCSDNDDEDEDYVPEKEEEDDPYDPYDDESSSSKEKESTRSVCRLSLIPFLTLILTIVANLYPMSDESFSVRTTQEFKQLSELKPIGFTDSYMTSSPLVMRLTLEQLFNGFQSKERSLRIPCPQCKHENSTAEECDVCDDSGYLTVNCTRMLDVQPGALNGSSSVYSLTNGKKVVITVDEKPHPVFTRKDKDLFMTVTVTMKEAIKGTQKQVRMIDGELETITIPAETKDGEMLIMENKGFIWNENTLLRRIISRYESLRGKLYIKIAVSSEQGDIVTL